MSGIETLSWLDGDTITAEKLQAMVQELRSLRVDIPDIRIQDERNDGAVIANIGNNLKVLVGTAIMPTDDQAQIVRRDVKFGSNSFSAGNAPIVIAQLATSDRVRSFVSVSGPGGLTQSPTADGFSVWVAHQVLPPNEEGQAQVLTMSRPQLVFWLAVGY